MALAESADWPKATLDLPVKSAEELRFFLLNRGWTIEKFKDPDGVQSRARKWQVSMACRTWKPRIDADSS